MCERPEHCDCGRVHAFHAAAEFVGRAEAAAARAGRRLAHAIDRALVWVAAAVSILGAGLALLALLNMLHPHVREAILGW